MAILTKSQRIKLGRLLERKRLEDQLSAREVARRAGLDVGTVTRIEQAIGQRPTIESLTAIAEVLGIPFADILTITEWLPAGELPSFTPYLRAKYRDMPASAISELEDYFQRVAKRHQISPDGPQAGEDE